MDLPKNGKIKDFNVYSDDVTEVLSTPPKSLFIYGNLIISTAVITLLILCWFIKFPDIIESEAYITTIKAPIKTISRSQGILKYLFVEDGIVVKKDEILAVVSDKEEYKDILLLNDFLQLFEKNYYHKKPITFPTSLVIGDLAIELAALKSLYQKYIVITEKFPTTNEVKEIKKQLLGTKALISNLDSRRINIDSQLHLKQKELDRQKKLLQGGVISEADFEQLNYELLSENSKKSELNYRVGELKNIINNLERQQKNIVTNELRNAGTTELDIIEIVNTLNAKIEIWKNQHILTSSIDGICSYQSYLQENQSIEEREELFVISPNTSNYEVRGILPVEKSGLVKRGQSVILKLPSMPYRDYGTLSGKVEKVSLISDEDGYMFFAKLENNDLISSYGKQIEYKPSLKANAEIVLEDTRLLERIFYEIKRIFS